MEKNQQPLLDTPEIPQRFFGDRERAEMHNRLEEGEIGIRIARLVECGEFKARLQAGEVNRGPAQGFGEIGEGAHGRYPGRTLSMIDAFLNQLNWTV